MVINNQLNNPNNIPPSNFDREDLKSLLKKELPDIIQRNFHLLSEDLNR